MPVTSSQSESKSCKCPVCGGDMSEGDSKHYAAENDADKLAESQKIREDTGRHKMAKAHLDHNAKTATKAAAMEDKVKSGLAKVFPKTSDEGSY
jgi:transcription initiation factor IIE alpha subunit